MDQHAKGDIGISEQRDKSQSQSQSAGACSLCFNNAPYVAAFSCGAFNTNLMSPLILNRPFGAKSSLVQNCCFTLAHVGVGLCIYKSVHQRKDLETYKKVLISATGSVLFNYGTLLVLANVKHYLPRSQILRCLTGVGVVAYMFWLGKEYLGEPTDVNQVD